MTAQRTKPRRLPPLCSPLPDWLITRWRREDDALRRARNAARRAGYEAALAGLSDEACPAGYSGLEAASWYGGWDAGEREMKRRAMQANTSGTN